MTQAKRKSNANQTQTIVQAKNEPWASCGQQKERCILCRPGLVELGKKGLQGKSESREHCVALQGVGLREDAALIGGQCIRLRHVVRDR
jgi:hypothetical protein